MSTSRSVDIVHAFWDEVWNAHDPAAADRFVVDDFVIVTGGQTVRGRESFKEWIAGFLAVVDDLHLEVVESFSNADGSRVASRWLLTGKNNGYLGSQADGSDIAMTGTAVWAVGEDGKLLTNWVERSAWELSRQLRSGVP
ncbi:ester cyclase [Mycolicibacterium flavescens]|uniref:SnoaL-like polyketide cyclase n=1 Tax=Mycolicibacterium flavescens TaxID=1776 RepID=A0A1E3RPU4_MYCFV|nr:nuclear transport factor 2 family protein [Mycolicibacterium flavescens]MCV7283205.1 ester cyclase [Mycolicibacterium flavescens]ODQ91871.1 SnoaL-like polyketide cyclase [Mycolicibacterium flavescens]